MSKRNIRPNSGKQLYLNQIFYKGMLYTSSEMQEGFAKVIDNYDIAPTGDAASPRYPLQLINGYNGNDCIDINNSYTIPVKFKQMEGKQSYVKFYNTISEEDFVKDALPNKHLYSKGIGIINRSMNAINTSVGFDNEISYTIGEVQEDNNTALREEYMAEIISSEGIVPGQTTPNSILYKQVSFDAITQKPQVNIIDLKEVGLSQLVLESTLMFTIKRYPFSVIDGDTFKDNNIFTDKNTEKEYRIFGIDCREIGQEWSEYAKIVFLKLVNHTHFAGWSSFYKNTDVYGRDVVSLNLYYRNASNPNYYYCIDVAEVMLYLGLAVMRYIDRVDDAALFDKYLNRQNSARINRYKIFNTNEDFDPFYYKPTPNFNISEGNNLKMTDTMTIEAVTIKESFNISAVTQNIVDFVKTVYIDYLDALAFIGRVIDTEDNSIVYKGPILLHARQDGEGNEFFTILLPSNQGEGVIPNLVEASTTNSYNLINSNLIHLENEKDENSAFSILGTAVVYQDIDGYIDSDNPSIVSQGILGQPVLLKAIVNEKGFYSYNDNTTTDNYGFDIVIDPIVIEGKVLFERRTISRAVNEFTNITTDALGLLDAIKRVRDELTEEELETYPLKLTSTWQDVLNLLPNNGLSIASITLIKNSLDNSQNIRLSSSEIHNTITDNVNAVWTGSILELRSELHIDGDELVIKFHNNFSAINMTFSSGSNLVIREDLFPIEFYSKWGVADYGSSTYRDISIEKLLITKLPNSSQLNLVGDWDDKIKKPTDLEFILSGNSNLTFRFSIQPKILNKLSNYCPEALSSIYLVNTFQEMYMTIPMLKIGTEVKLINSKDLRVNMDIKNATRIDMFNRQLCVYGPYTISNALFFSKFETFDYFPFPSGVIELEEPITWVYNYKDALMVFGKNHMHMLSGATLANECTLHKIYENLSVHLPDVRAVNTVGNNLIFFNNGVGYVIVPNMYVDSSSNIKVYKLTEYISNFFYNPESYIRNRIPGININTQLTYKMELDSYVQNNDIIITNNITIQGVNEEKYHLVTWFIYNQDYKYWRMYSTTLFDRIVANYVCEPNINHQFVVWKDTDVCMAFFTNVYTNDYRDTSSIGTRLPIQTMLNSGYLSVDTMNDKRFKDLIVELDRIDPNAKLYVNCEFFVDGSPMILSDSSAIVIDKTTGEVLETDKILSEYKDYELHHIGGTPYDTPENISTRSQTFGSTFMIDNNIYSITGRTHMRIPVYGKGRLPSFILKIQAEKFYEFINYALIYKEKNINRRS